ncbi:hypothetical protein CDAR_521851 [Caerostris darwini]|uniref:Uncharacterized protein n=1 Tax=Caerostris darwini TaxID=1538125 RepID=A0AAV4RZM4_9ARAC|nr:hypothetical protein CDAR_521851 [Caerostris darwini]
MKELHLSKPQSNSPFISRTKAWRKSQGKRFKSLVNQNLLSGLPSVVRIMHQIHGMRLPNRTLWTASNKTQFSVSPERIRGHHRASSPAYRFRKKGDRKEKERDITMAAVPVRLTDAKRYCLT